MHHLDILVYFQTICYKTLAFIVFMYENPGLILIVLKISYNATCNSNISKHDLIF